MLLNEARIFQVIFRITLYNRDLRVAHRLISNRGGTVPPFLSPLNSPWTFRQMVLHLENALLLINNRERKKERKKEKEISRTRGEIERPIKFE